MKKQVQKKQYKADNKQTNLEKVIAMKLAVDMIEQKGSTITVHCPSLSDADTLNKELLYRYTEQIADSFNDIAASNSKPQLYIL